MPDTILPLVPETCMICGAAWKGGCQVPGARFPKKGLRVFYDCGASLSVIDREKELGHEGHLEDYCYFLRLKNCHGLGQG